MPTLLCILALALGLLGLAGGSPAQDQVRTWGYFANDSELFTTALRKVSIGNGTRGWILGLTRDGRIVGCGGESPPPLPPPGLRYVDVFASLVPFGLLSDGSLVQFEPYSIGTSSPTSAPILPPGLRWLEMTSTYHHTFALRSDRTLHHWGVNFVGVESVPTLASGQHFASLAAGPNWMAALLSDGTIITWGTSPSIAIVQPVPVLPPGLAYTALGAGRNHMLALRSDGQAIAWGDNSWGQLNIPPLPAGMTYVAISAGAITMQPCAAMDSGSFGVPTSTAKSAYRRTLRGPSPGSLRVLRARSPSVRMVPCSRGDWSVGPGSNRAACAT